MASASSTEQLALDLPARIVPDERDCLYAAGFFDGEGCISVNQVGKGFRAQLNVPQVDLVPLEWLRERWGGEIYRAQGAGKRKGRQNHWQWCLNRGSRQVAFLEDLRPFMKVKGTVTDNALAFLRLKLQTGRRKLTETQQAALREHVVIHRGFGEAKERQRFHPGLTAEEGRR